MDKAGTLDAGPEERRKQRKDKAALRDEQTKASRRQKLRCSDGSPRCGNLVSPLKMIAGVRVDRLTEVTHE